MGEPGRLAAPLPSAITGLVLAGGAARRMGGADKGLQCFQGQPLAQRAALRLVPQVARVLISANRHLDVYRRWDWPVITDLPGHASQGPLAGILAGLAACTTPWLACVPCDVPHFPIDLVARLAAQVEQAKGTLVVYATAPDGPTPHTPARRHPTCCLLHTALRQPLASYLQDGGRRLDAWMRSQPHAEVCFDDAGAFVNLNTLADLVSAEQSPRPSPDQAG